MKLSANPSSYPAANVFRRLLALAYDGMLTFAVMMLAAMIPTLATTTNVEYERQSVYSCIIPSIINKSMPLKHSPDLLENSLCISSYLSIRLGNTLDSNNPLFILYVFGILFLYTGWFWVKGGQSLGMRAWKIKLETLDGKNVTWSRALIRWLLALLTCASFAIGFLWMIFDPKKQTLYDRLTKTRVVHVDKDYVPELL